MLQLGEDRGTVSAVPRVPGVLFGYAAGSWITPPLIHDSDPDRA